MGEEKERIILHSDLNAFYASVEMLLHPELQGKAVAVCGSTEQRHGIVLAKSELAKRAGVKTGMVNAQALNLCPGLVLVAPHYDMYAEFSRLARSIYEQYTDLVEPFGMDECWLDVSGSTNLFGSGEEIAQRIRREIKCRLGLTVSVGVSFNKVFAKLASDLKKPDAVTVVSRENFREKVFPLSVRDLLYVGHATEKRLNTWGIRTIGQLAGTDPVFLKKLLGVNGVQLWNYANGRDSSLVCRCDHEVSLKSVSHGITCASDLTDKERVWRVILELSQTLGDQLRRQKQIAWGVELYLRYRDFSGERFSSRLAEPGRSPLQIAQAAQRLFEANDQRLCPVRAVTVALSPLSPENQPFQPDLFRDSARLDRLERVEETASELRQRFGAHSIFPATLLTALPAPEERPKGRILPGRMFES